MFFKGYGVKINTKTGTVQPTMLITKLKPEESWKVAARTSIVFSIKNPYDEQDREKKKKKSCSNQAKNYHT